MLIDSIFCFTKSMLVIFMNRVEGMMKKLAISKDKQQQQKKKNPDSEKENQEPNPKSDEEEEEVIDTTNNNKKKTRRGGKKKILNPDFMNNEKERYLSRLANVADLISSSSSEPDDEDDEDFDLDKYTPESDSGESDASSLVKSSQITESEVTVSEDVSYVSEARFEKDSSGIKRISNESSGSIYRAMKKGKKKAK